MKEWSFIAKINTSVASSIYSLRNIGGGHRTEDENRIKVNPHKCFDQCQTCLYNPDYAFALSPLDCLPDHQMISRVKIYLLINTILST